MPASLSQSRGTPKSGPVPIGFPAKAKLFDLDNPASCVYLLSSGYVRLASGHEAIVDYLGPGSFFGEKCLLASQCRGQIATSLSPVEVLAFRKSELLDRVRQDRRFAERLLKNLALRLDRHEQTIRDCVVERVERRLARLLIRLMPARSASGWVRLSVSPSNSELAKTIGTTRWQVAHFMRQFQRLEWLDRRPELWVRSDGIRAFVESAPAA